tara:strand:+ start:240 stop:734 length:495 start_codon:yes stop_codon:yes gene_type:complete
LLAAARELLITGGLMALGIEQLSKVTGYSRPTIYNHFASRDAILLALAQRNLEVTSELIAKARRFDGTTRERAFGLILAYELTARFEEGEFHVTEALGIPWVRSTLEEEDAREFIAMVIAYSNNLTELVELLLEICFLRGALERAVEGSGDGEKGGCLQGSPYP